IISFQMSAVYAANDPRFQHCCSCCRMHVTTAAQASTIFNVIVNVALIAYGLKGGNLFTLIFSLSVMALSIYAVFWEKRKPLIVFIVYYSLGVAFCVIVSIAILLAALVFGSAGARGRDDDAGAFSIISNGFTIFFAIFCLPITMSVCYTLKVLINFHRYLGERDQAHQPPVVFEARTEEKETLTTLP
ncbi:hypothetical protein PFISCL1PPCAC_5373, partial [Pristionchus fissidentatus]